MAVILFRIEYKIPGIIIFFHFKRVCSPNRRWWPTFYCFSIELLTFRLRQKGWCFFFFCSMRQTETILETRSGRHFAESSIPSIKYRRIMRKKCQISGKLRIWKSWNVYRISVFRIDAVQQSHKPRVKTQIRARTRIFAKRYNQAWNPSIFFFFFTCR